MFQCPFCRKLYSNYDSLQRHASRLSQTLADLGKHCEKLPHKEEIVFVPSSTAAEEPRPKVKPSACC